MKSKIIAITRPVDGLSPDDFIAYTARISNPLGVL